MIGMRWVRPTLGRGWISGRDAAKLGPTGLETGPGDAVPNSIETTPLHFGPFRLAHDGRLLRKSSSVPLAPKELALLRLLATSEGRVVSKHEILDRLWPDEDVGDASLTSCVHGLRAALGDRGRHGRYVETVHGRGYRFTAPVRRGDATPDAAGDRLRIAIVPFEEQPAAEAYLIEGLVADVIARLGSWRTQGIDAIARQSAARKWAAHRDLLRLADELRLDFVVTGRTRSRKDDLEIAVELIRVRDEVVVWSGVFASHANDPAPLAAEIAESLAKRLVEARGEVFAARQQPPASQDPRSYRALLRGNFLNQFRTEVGLRRSIRCFEQALEWDPNCAAAHAALAEAYLNLGWRGYAPPVECGRAARGAIARALDIDGQHVAAHAALATLRAVSDWDPGAADEALAATARAEIVSDRIPWLRGTVQLMLGRFDDSVAEMDAALEVDPFSPNLMVHRVLSLWFGGRDEEALASARVLADAEPEFAAGRALRGAIAATVGLHDEALQAAEAADELARGDQFARSLCGWTFAMSGRPDSSRAILATLERRSRNRYVSPSFIAAVYAGLGETESALAWLERARELRCMAFPLVGVDRRFDALVGDPRFEALERHFPRPGANGGARNRTVPAAAR